MYIVLCCRADITLCVNTDQSFQWDDRDVRYEITYWVSPQELLPGAALIDDILLCRVRENSILLLLLIWLKTLDNVQKCLLYTLFDGKKSSWNCMITYYVIACGFLRPWQWMLQNIYMLQQTLNWFTSARKSRHSPFF